MPRSKAQGFSNEIASFLEDIREGQGVIEATQRAGLSKSTLYRLRTADPAFAAAWREAQEAGQLARRPSWIAEVADAVADGEEVTTAARSRGRPTSSLYRWRQRDPEIARRMPRRRK